MFFETPSFVLLLKTVERMTCPAWMCVLLLCLCCSLSSYAQMLRITDNPIPSNCFLKSNPLQDHGTNNCNGRELLASKDIILTEKKAGRGKGSGGGSNVVHQRPGKKSEAARPFNPSYNAALFIILLILAFSFALP